MKSSSTAVFVTRNCVCVCMYVCMHACMYIRIYVRTYVRMYVCTHTHTHRHRHTHTHTCINTCSLFGRHSVARELNYVHETPQMNQQLPQNRHLQNAAYEYQLCDISSRALALE